MVSIVERGKERGGKVPHDVAGVLELLDLGDHVPMVLLLRGPEGVGFRHGEADEGQTGPVLEMSAFYGMGSPRGTLTGLPGLL
jgi:hypothetical protein